MKRIVLFVEGEGEADAVPNLVTRLLHEQGIWDVFVDQNPFRVGEIGRLVKDEFREWKRKLQAALKRGQVGGVLLLLDGDIAKVRGVPFCAANVARDLAEAAKSVGAGSMFSVASIFVRQEYESWLIASLGAFLGKSFPDGREFPQDAKPPDGDLEESPRAAKGWLSRLIDGGYKETRDQITLTRWLDFQLVRDRGMRSFRRLESALEELVTAIRSENHIASPTRPDA